jgi:amino acid permease
MAINEDHGIEVANTSGAAFQADGFSDPEKQRIVEVQEEENLSRSLKQRHIQMIALAGAIVCFLLHLPVSGN